MEQIDTPLPALSATSQRHDGWTVERQRQFCEALAECGVVAQAARAAGMSVRNAYRLRRTPAGQAFALAWDAALSLARQRLIDDAFELAFEGSHEVVMRDGAVYAERRRRDSRTLLMTLDRLNACPSLSSRSTRAVAGNFDGFLETLGQKLPTTSVKTVAHAPGRTSPERGEDGRFLPKDEGW